MVNLRKGLTGDWENRGPKGECKPRSFNNKKNHIGGELVPRRPRRKAGQKNRDIPRSWTLGSGNPKKKPMALISKRGGVPPRISSLVKGEQVEQFFRSER